MHALSTHVRFLKGIDVGSTDDEDIEYNEDCLGDGEKVDRSSAVKVDQSGFADPLAMVTKLLVAKLDMVGV